MGCEGLLTKPLNLRNEAMLREFLFERGNQWERTMRDPEQWTGDAWADVYSFVLWKGEGWVSWKDTYFLRKFKAENNPKDGFYAIDCRNPREQRVIEFLLPILYPDKPKRLSITMANTIFRAPSRVRLVNWGRLIQKLVEKFIPHTRRKHSPLSPYLHHLYQQNICVKEEEEDALTFAEDIVAYKLTPEVEPTEAGTEESLSEPTAPELQ